MKINQVLAIESHERTRMMEAHRWFTQGIRSLVMDGHMRTYIPKDEDGEVLHPDAKLIETTVHEVVGQLVSYYVPWMDAVASKDFGNVVATASVELDGESLVVDAPVPLLLFLEKTLTEWRGYINSLPSRDQQYHWLESDTPHVYRTEPVSKNRNIKEQVPLELSPATKEHPAQVKLVEKAVFKGTWSEVQLTGKVSLAQKERWLARCDRLIAAVRTAREGANTTEIAQADLASDLFRFVFETDFDDVETGESPGRAPSDR